MSIPSKIRDLADVMGWLRDAAAVHAVSMSGGEEIAYYAKLKSCVQQLQIPQTSGRLVALLCRNEPFRMRQNGITAGVDAPVRVQSSLNWGKCVTPNLSLD